MKCIYIRLTTIFCFGCFCDDFWGWDLRIKIEEGNNMNTTTEKKYISHSISPIIFMSPSCYYIIQFLYHLFDKLKWGVLTWRTKETKITPTFKIDPTSDLASKSKKIRRKKKIRSNKICTNNFFYPFSSFFLWFFFRVRLVGKYYSWYDKIYNL